MRNLQITQSITNRSSSVDIYFNDISKEDMVSAQEEIILAQKIKQGDKAALERLTKSNLRFVVSVAKKYQFQGLPLSDLINEGNIGLIKAAEKFDETRGFKFISFAVWWIRQSIMAALGEHSRMVRLPLNKVNELSRINKALASVEQETFREPTAEQVAARLETTTEKVTELLSQSQRTTTIDLVYEGEEYSLLEKIACNDFPADQAIMAESHAMEIKSMLSKLSPREKRIIELTYGLTGELEMSPIEIAPHLGLSKERVRQIRNIALEKLRSIKN